MVLVKALKSLDYDLSTGGPLGGGRGAEEFAFAVKVIGSAPAVGLGLLVSSVEMEG
jgi:hypothetical protein